MASTPWYASIPDPTQEPKGVPWTWPADPTNPLVANNLISGFVFNIYMTAFSNCISYSDMAKCKDNTTIWANLPRSIFMSIDTVYMDNPAEYKQLWKPIDANAATSPAQWGALLAPNSTIEIKFDPGYYLGEYACYKDPYGAVVGMKLVAQTADGSQSKTYEIGEAMTYQDFNDPSTIFNRYQGTAFVPSSCMSGSNYVTGFSGYMSNRGRDNQHGGFFSMDTCTASIPPPAISIDYNNSANYQCCFKSDLSKCTDEIAALELCEPAVNTFCTAKPTDYTCRKYLAAQKLDSGDTTGQSHTALAMLYGFDSNGNPINRNPDGGTGAYVVITGTPDGYDTSVTLERFSEPDYEPSGESCYNTVLLLLLIVIVALLFAASVSCAGCLSDPFNTTAH
jgi:hypothetical protein